MAYEANTTDLTAEELLRAQTNELFRPNEGVVNEMLKPGFQVYVDTTEPMVRGEGRKVFEACMEPLSDLAKYVKGSNDPRLDPEKQREAMEAWYSVGPNEPVLSAQIWEANGANGQLRCVGALFTRPAYVTERRRFGWIGPNVSVQHPASAMLIMRDRYVSDRRFQSAIPSQEGVPLRRAVIVSANPDNPVARRVSINYAPRLPEFRVRALGDNHFTIERPEWPKGVADARPAFMVRARSLPQEYQEPAVRQAQDVQRFQQARRAATAAVAAVATLG